MPKQEVVLKTILAGIAIAAVAALGYIALGAFVLEPSQPAASEPPEEEAGENQTLTITDSTNDAYSNIKEPGMVLLNSPEEARRRLGADFIRNTRARELDIDWEQEMAVAVFLGRRNSGGYSVEIQDVEIRGETAIVQARERAPGTGCAVTMAITSPFALAVLERHELDMELELETRQYSCE